MLARPTEALSRGPSAPKNGSAIYIASRFTYPAVCTKRAGVRNLITSKDAGTREPRLLQGAALKGRSLLGHPLRLPSTTVEWSHKHVSEPRRHRLPAEEDQRGRGLRSALQGKIKHLLTSSGCIAFRSTHFRLEFFVMLAYAPGSGTQKCAAQLSAAFIFAAVVATTGEAADLRLQLRQPLPQERPSSALPRDELFKDFLIWLKKREQH